MISYTVGGSTNNMRKFLQAMQAPTKSGGLTSLAQRGVATLQAATPKESGETASSWSYEVETKGGKTSIYWTNSHTEHGVNIAIILQYGHGTGTGGYVAGRDYINPAIQPIMDEIANDMWKMVTTS